MSRMLTAAVVVFVVLAVFGVYRIFRAKTAVPLFTGTRENASCLSESNNQFVQETL